MPFDAADFTLPVAPAIPSTPHERLVALREHLHTVSPQQFSIEGYGFVKQCGTVACFAGWCEVLFGSGHPSNARIWNSAEMLGLTEAQSEALFTPTGWSTWSSKYIPNTYTLPSAIRVLDILIAEGVVDWPRAIAEVAA